MTRLLLKVLLIVSVMWIDMGAAVARRGDNPVVLQMMNTALNAISRSSRASRKRYLIPYNDAAKILTFSQQTGLLLWCGYAAQNKFSEYMARERLQNIWSQDQEKYIDTLHTLSMNNVRNRIQHVRGGCDKETKVKAQRLFEMPIGQWPVH